MNSIHRVIGKASVVFILILAFCQGSAIGNPSTALIENFTITAADNSVNTSVWNLKYSESENPIRITMEEKNGIKEYTVRNKFFEVAYVINKSGFGARLVKPGKAQVPDQILSQIINQDALKNQKIISNSQIDNATALNLIASYLPDLINNNYKHLLQ